ncbi:hypothetical protein GCM10027447_14020 [Glycomyces halotolerans]
MSTTHVRATAAAAAATVAALALSACGGGGDGGGGDGDGESEISWAIASSWESWNQNTTSGNNSYLHQALVPSETTLGDFDENGEWFHNDALLAQAPELAGEDPMQVEYTLNENAQWSDGEPFRLEDFVYVWYQMSGDADHCNQDKCQPASTDWGSNVASIEENEPGVITMTYVDGYLDPEWEFFQTPMYPTHIAEAEGFEDWQDDPEVMGDSAEFFAETAPTWSTGPYTPVDAQVGQYVIYEPNENYQGSVEPSLDRLTLRVVEGTEAIVTEMRQGAIHGAWPSQFNAEELAKLDEDEALQYEVYDGSIWIHIDANTRGEFLSDADLRRAVYTTIDNADIIAKNYPDTDVTPRTNHFFSESSQYHEDILGATEPVQGSGDADAARQLLEDNDYTWNDEDQLLTPDGEQVTLDFRYGETDTVRRTTAELVQSYLAQIGIDVSLSAIPDGELGPVLTSGEFDLVIFGWSGTPAFTTAPFQFFGSESGSNFGGFELEGLDEVIAQVRSTTDIDESAEYANEVDRMVMPEAYVLPLFDEPQSIMWNTNSLSGVTANGNSQAGPLFNVREWEPA